MGDAKEGFKKASAYSTIDPDSFVIQDDPAGPYYDKRIELPLIPEMVANIVAIGVRETVVMTEHEGKTYVVSGRQRAKHWREACKVWKERGEPVKPLPCAISRLKPEVASIVNTSCNTFRQDESMMTRITNAVHALALGTSEDDVCMANGISKAQLKNWLKADSLCAPVKKAIDNGQVTVTAATKLSDLPAAEQKEKLDEIISSGVKPTVAAVKRAAKNEKPKKKGLTPRQLDDLCQNETTPQWARVFIQIILGEADLADAGDIQELEWLH